VIDQPRVVAADADDRERVVVEIGRRFYSVRYAELTAGPLRRPPGGFTQAQLRGIQAAYADREVRPPVRRRQIRVLLSVGAVYTALAWFGARRDEARKKRDEHNDAD